MESLSPLYLWLIVAGVAIIGGMIPGGLRALVSGIRGPGAAGATAQVDAHGVTVNAGSERYACSPVVERRLERIDERAERWLEQAIRTNDLLAQQTEILRQLMRLAEVTREILMEIKASDDLERQLADRLRQNRIDRDRAEG